MEYRGHFRDIEITNCCKLVHGNDANAMNNELKYQIMRNKKEIDRGIAVEDSTLNQSG